MTTVTTVLLLATVFIGATSKGLQRRTASTDLCDVSQTEREDCGYYGITEAECTNKGCCWWECNGCSQEVPWCFRSAGDSPKITLAPSNARVVENGVASFFCKAFGNPAPDVYWRKNGESISENQQRYQTIDMSQGSVLRIEPVRSGTDDSTYQCVADNGIGAPAAASSTLQVYPEGQVPSGYPRITESPTLKAVEKGQDTVMLCSAVGNPNPTIMWLQDSLPVDLTDPRLELIDTGALQIRQSQETDQGKYECVAENSAGVAYSYGANLYVRVRREPPHFSTP